MSEDAIVEDARVYVRIHAPYDGVALNPKFSVVVAGGEKLSVMELSFATIYASPDQLREIRDGIIQHLKEREGDDDSQAS